MKIFSKFKDYTEMLEEILDKKYFSGQIKNLLLSMLYKIEISYNDFERVKKVVRDKEEYILELLNIIQKYCDNLKIVKPDSSQANLLEKNKVLAVTNEKERSALVYATEKSLLYAIADIEPKYFYISPKFIFKNTFQRMLVTGSVQNTVEVLYNFNGWSWDTTLKDSKDFDYNLIYQNLLFMFEEEFLNDWRGYASSRRDFLSEMRIILKDITGNNDYFNILCKHMYKKTTSKDKEKIDALLKFKIKELKKMENKEKYLEDATENKKKYTKVVEYIDKVINDKNLLMKEFAKYNSKLEEKKRVKNIKTFSNMLENERQKYLDEISECSYVLKPTNFLKKMAELKSFEEIYKDKSSERETLMELQKCFLNFFDKKINKVETKEDIMKIFYILRYYKYLSFSKGKLIKDIEELNQEIDKIYKKLITKACKLGILKILSMDIKENYELIKDILDTKILKLEDIKIKAQEFPDDKNIIVFDIYDNDILDKQIAYDTYDNKKIEIKLKRMMKLFN